MQKVCQQNIKVKNINVTKGKSWAVYGDSELGVAEGAFLNPYGTALPPLLHSTSMGTSLPPHPPGLENPFFFKLLDPNASRSEPTLPAHSGDGCRLLGKRPRCPYLLSGQSTELWDCVLTAALLGLAGAVWVVFHCIIRGKNKQKTHE